jgi:ubiquinone/menaquinone biosynthesis C-methylase UbiE
VENVAGNHYDKYKSKNPIERKLVKGFFDNVATLFNLVKQDCEPERILEAGCGEGVFSSFTRSMFPRASFDAFDLEQSVVSEAIRRYGNLDIHFFTGSIYEIDKEDSSIQLIVCSEVLEHLEHPGNALKELKRVASGYLFLSVPQEPVWRLLNMCRFKYWTDFGNTPGHIQHFSRRRFLGLIHEVGGLEVVAYRQSLPWQMVLLRKER